MGTLRFADLQTRPTEVLELTSLTLDEWQRLVPAFAAAFEAPRAAWRLAGRPRTARRYTTSTNCPLPTPADAMAVVRQHLWASTHFDMSPAKPDMVEIPSALPEIPT
jgi:hypothetical protein